MRYDKTRLIALPDGMAQRALLTREPASEDRRFFQLVGREQNRDAVLVTHRPHYLPPSCNVAA